MTGKWGVTERERDVFEEDKTASERSDAVQSPNSLQRTTDSQDVPGRDSSRAGEHSEASSVERTSSRPVSSGPVSTAPSSSESTSSGPTTTSEYEQRYGVEIDRPGEAARLQQLEAANGLERVREWAEEGIPVAAMGSKSKMAAYRQRTGTPVPWDVERRNEQSRRRNAVAQRRTGPAGETRVPDELRRALSSPGRGLDEAVRERKEEQFGRSFAHVRLHVGPRATAATDAIDAAAATVGNHILVNDPDFDPQSPRGDYVLSHELAHVAQQTDGAVDRLPTDDAALQVDPDPALEREADETARQVLRGEPGAIGAGPTTDAGVSVQRMDPGGPPQGNPALPSLEELDPPPSLLDQQLLQPLMFRDPVPPEGGRAVRMMAGLLSLVNMHGAFLEARERLEEHRNLFLAEADRRIFDMLRRSDAETPERRTGQQAQIREFLSRARAVNAPLGRNWDVNRRKQGMRALQAAVLAPLSMAEQSGDFSALSDREREYYQFLSTGGQDGEMNHLQTEGFAGTFLLNQLQAPIRNLDHENRERRHNPALWRRYTHVPALFVENPAAFDS